ncbi:fungal-specific transcription factor domain-containing protein [Aspergillus ambiguus]|uniref:fungal specific transcription factor domain-containing protein n=1 Tax=Aspergillus ambiguus TaxID=176160 RepID=UPI003CCDE30C
MEPDASTIENAQLTVVKNSHPTVHWMKPLDNLIATAHELLDPPLPRSICSSVLPAYIEDLPYLPFEDIQYLAAKDVFKFPDATLRNELLKTFVHNVYPYIPLLDLRTFLQAIACNDGNIRVSLLLFHAVMFSSTAFIEPEHLHRAGYTSRKAARQEFYQKCRVLYDFDVETDRVAVIQAVLLMTYWHEQPDDPKNFHHWMDIALSLAASTIKDLKDPAISPSTRRIWKRLWWCLYTRDRLVSLNLRRPAIIHDDDFRIPFLTVDDFETNAFDRTTTHTVGNWEILRSSVHQTQLAQLFIAKAKLCTILSGLLSRNTPLPDLSSPLMSVSQYTQDLDDWEAALAPELKYRCPSSKNLSKVEKTLFAYRAWLKLLFLNASSAIPRQQRALRSATPSSEMEAEILLSEKRVQSAMSAIALVAEGLYRADAIHYLPTTTVGLLLPVLAIHILNIRSGSPDQWAIGFKSFYQCMRVLEQLGEVYMLAESMVAYFENAICGFNKTKDDKNVSTPRLLEEVLTSAELKSFIHIVGRDVETL